MRIIGCDLHARQQVELSTNQVSARNAKPNMVFDSSRGTVLIFGGGNRGKLIGDLWELKGRSWHPAAN